VLKGGVYMAFAMAAFVSNDTLLKLLSDELPVGTLLRILPNHACATGAQHERYRVLGEAGRVEETWERFSGW